MTEMQSSTVSSCWAVTGKGETGSELWIAHGNSIVTLITCFGNYSAKCNVYSPVEKCHLQADRFYMTLVQCFRYAMPNEVIILKLFVC
jgi:hypothetical protein